MLTFGNIIVVCIGMAIYIHFLLFEKAEIRERLKTYIYCIVFIGLLLPDIETIEFPYGLHLDIQLYAVVICGIELTDRFAKHIIKSKINKGKQLSKKEKDIYDSL